VLGLLLVTVYFYHITQTLEGVKGKTNRKYEFQCIDAIIPSQEMRYSIEIIYEEIEVLEDE
jgi:hypothetical protein